MLASLPNLQGKEKSSLLHHAPEKETLGSDGETSDYQRSTPSPRDGDSHITELITEGLEKCEDETSSSCWKGSTSSSSSSSSTSSLSPDLGFVDCLDLPSTSYKSSCDKKLPFICLSELKTTRDGLPALPSLNLEGPTRGFSFVQSRGGSEGAGPKKALPTSQQQPPPPPPAKLPNKKVSVNIEKLPTVMSLVDRRRRAAVDKNVFLVKRGALSSSLSPRRAFANSRFDSSASPSSGRTREISLPKQGLVLNSFRLSQPSSTATLHARTTETNFTSFATRTFYKTDQKNFNDNNPSSDNVSKTEVSSSSSSCSSSRRSEDHVTSSPSPASDPCLSSECSVSLPGSPSSGSLVASPVKPSSEAGESESTNGCRPFRFPTLAGNSSAIPCKWDGCGQGFKSHGKLSDHIKTVHMSPQLEAEAEEAREFSCMWLGCKVYGMKSSSRSWLQKHVPLHGGKLMFTCIVEGCKMRFSSQVMLERHVNSHFSESSTGSSQSGPKKSIEGAPARKVLKRAGVKLKFRKLPFSARIFDFFDTGMMAGIRHRVSSVHRLAPKFNIADDTMTFHSKAMSLRLGESDRREVQLRWMPENMLPDEWVPLDQAVSTKSVKISLLPEAAKIRLQHELLLKPRTGKQSRKRKYIQPPSPFLTPAERSLEMASVKTAPTSSSAVAALFL